MSAVSRPPSRPSAVLQHDIHSPSRSPSPQRIPSGAPRRSANSKAARKPMRREAIRLTHAPLKLTVSQFDLFAAATGNTIRTGDPYARFLLGPRKVKVDVPTLAELEKEQKRAAAATVGPGGGLVGVVRTKKKEKQGTSMFASQTSVVMVGKGTSGFSKEQKGTAATAAPKRKFRVAKKEQYKMDLVSKWDRLEDMRIQ
ncbi:hypothetical protein HKX48_008882 [Thoreauomyces humboldtii]|nr:hypothetical protein HKX48_008882 [Thoreauomyces humboldtii]